MGPGSGKRLFCDDDLARLEVIPYLLPLCGWSTSRGTILQRRGFIVRAFLGETLIGFGDCAPLEDAGTESLARAQSRLSTACRELPGHTLEESLQFIQGWTDVPATRFALETALLDLVAQLEATPLSKWLALDAATSVKANAAIGSLDAGTMQRCRQAVIEGYDVLKIKVGSDTIDNDIKRLEEIVENLNEDMSLRLDANGAWSLDAAEAFVHAAEGLPIESLEEPLQDVAALGRLQGITPWPIAIDESVSLWSRAELASNPPTRRIVCKPAVLGGLSETLAFAKELEAHGAETVITTTLESAAGTWACVQLAAAVNNQLAHGLATSSWFRANTGIPPEVRAGRIDLPATAGLGFVPRDGGQGER